MSDKLDLDIPPFTSFTKKWHHSPYDAISLSRPELSAKGKTVVVSGGGTGIGKAIAKAFVQAGASSVAILGRREDRLRSAISEFLSVLPLGAHTKVLYEVADLTDRAQTIAAFDKIVDAQGISTIDIFVNNAGGPPIPGLAHKLKEQDFMTAFDRNVRNTLNAIHAFLPRAAQQNAVLLNISSGVAHMSPVTGISGHAVSKAAATKLVDYVAAENPALHVVQVQPGVIATEATAKAGINDSKHPDEGEFVMRRCSSSPVVREHC